MERFWEIDFLRGTAICMMIVFHFAWDLNYLGLAEISLYTGFWGLFQKATASLFLALVGVGVSLSFNRQKEGFEKRILKRAAKIALAALLLTFVSISLFPTRPILFGILHLIAFSLIVSIPLAKHKNASLVLAVLIFFGSVLFDTKSLGVNSLYWLGVGAPLPALDFFPVLPWISAVFFGIWIGDCFYPNAKPVVHLDEPKSRGVKIIKWLGRYSFEVYLVHQPVLFALFFVLLFVTGMPLPRLF